MALKNKRKQSDILISKLERASIWSAAGNESWDGFCDFLDDFETLAQLHAAKSTDVARLTKRKHICYRITGMENASDQIDTQRTTEVLSRIGRLIQSPIFPSKADFCVLVDWLDQLAFLFELTWPDGDSPVESLEQALTITEKLMSFCAERLEYANTGQIQRDYSAFEKTCPIVKQGVSRIYGPTINLKAVKVMRKLANIMDKSKFVGVYGKDFIDRISDDLWSIVREDLRDMAKRCFACNYKMIKSRHETSLELYGEILNAISHLPPNIEALEFFLTELGARSRPESDAVDLAILKCAVKWTQGSNNIGLWPILNTHMSRKDPNIRNECLKIARGRFGGDGDDEIIKAMLKHLDLIIEDTAMDKSNDCQVILNNLVRLLCWYPCGHSVDVDLYLTRILKYAPVEHLNENITEPIESIALINGDQFGKVANERFQQIYQDGVESRDRVVALRSLYKLIEAAGDLETSCKREYLATVAAGCQGSAPKGCNELLFRILNETKALAEGDNELCLLPLARAVYDQDES